MDIVLKDPIDQDEQKNSVSLQEPAIYESENESDMKVYIPLILDGMKTSSELFLNGDVFLEFAPYFDFTRTYLGYTPSYSEFIKKGTPFNNESRFATSFDTYVKDVMLGVTNGREDMKFGGRVNYFYITKPNEKGKLYEYFNFSILANDREIINAMFVVEIDRNAAELTKMATYVHLNSGISQEIGFTKGEVRSKGNMELLNAFGTVFTGGNFTILQKDVWQLNESDLSMKNLKEFWENNGEDAYFEFKLVK